MLRTQVAYVQCQRNRSDWPSRELWLQPFIINIIIIVIIIINSISTSTSTSSSSTTTTTDDDDDDDDDGFQYIGRQK